VLLSLEVGGHIMQYDETVLNELEDKAKIIRKGALELMKRATVCWLGGSFSQANIITALLFHHMRHDPKQPNWEERDRLIISKGHSCEIVYSALCEAGYFPRDEFASYSSCGALLQAHVDRKVPGIEFSGGSLGTGLSFAIGEALAARIDGAGKAHIPQATGHVSRIDDTGRLAETAGPSDSGHVGGTSKPLFRVYCIIGDGECDEGQVWEAAMSAAHFNIDNLTAIIDRNKAQATGKVEDKMRIEPLADKWRSFGWDVSEVDGHDFSKLLPALEKTSEVTGKPQLIIAHTEKGKGVPASFEKMNLHWPRMDDTMYDQIIEVLDKGERS
jgi:transketolase